MSYSTNPVADAERHYDAAFAASERQEAMTAEAATQIREAFAAFKPVPYVQINSLGGSAKVRYMSFEEAMNDTIGYEDIGAMLIDTLKTSECPKVKALLKAMSEKYVYMWADDIGGVL